MALRGTVKSDGERFSISLPATKIGPWLLVNIKREDRQILVDSSHTRLTDIDLALPGFNLADGRSGWIFIPESKSVQVFVKAKQFSSSPKTSIFLVLVDEVELPKLSDRVVTSKFGTETFRLEVSTMWNQVVLQGEVFVVNTVRGYVPAILVRMKSGEMRHLLIGASSLASELQEIRAKYGSLDGRPIRVRKADSSRVAPYLVEDLSGSNLIG